MSRDMKAIVVRQPWATLIALGVKTIETRPGPPNGPMRPDGVRGLPGCTLERGERIAIVAGASKPKESQTVGRWMVNELANGSWTMAGWDAELPLTRHRLPLGAVVCTATVDAAWPVYGDVPRNDQRPAFMLDDRFGDPLLTLWHTTAEARPWHGPAETHYEHQADQLPLGDFTPGRWGWLLGDVRPCPLIPCKGAQGVFRLPADVAAEVPS